MDINSLMINDIATFIQLSSIHVIVMALGGCTNAEVPGVYRESQGKVAKFVVDQTDPVIKITWFIRLQDGSVIRPKLYYYQARQVFLAYRSVEEPGKISRTIARDLEPKYRVLHLPVSEDIDSYLLLVRKPIPKEAEEGGRAKIEYELSEWKLLETPAKDVSKDKPIVFPSFEELAQRELTKEQEELLKDLVARYEKLEAEAKKKMETPIPLRVESPPP